MSDYKARRMPEILAAVSLTLLLTTQTLGGNDPTHPHKKNFAKGSMLNASRGNAKTIRSYAPVDGLKMYYEIEGTGEPLVIIPPAFGFAGSHSFPALRKSHSVITVDLQGNGRTEDIPDRPISIEQYAKDVVGLLKYLGIQRADFFGESYGGNTVAVIAVRHPEMVRRAVTYSATFGPPQDALDPVTTHFDRPPTADSDYIQFQRRAIREWLQTRDIGRGFLRRSATCSGRGFRKRSWRQSKCHFSFLWEIATLCTWSMRLQLSGRSPTPSLQ